MPHGTNSRRRMSNALSARCGHMACYVQCNTPCVAKLRGRLARCPVPFMIKTTNSSICRPSLAKIAITSTSGEAHACTIEVPHTHCAHSCACPSAEHRTLRCKQMRASGVFWGAFGIVTPCQCTGQGQSRGSSGSPGRCGRSFANNSATPGMSRSMARPSWRTAKSSTWVQSRWACWEGYSLSANHAIK